MFCGKDANHRTNSTHKRALRILHNDYDSSLDKILTKSDIVTIHTKNFQKLMLEIYKSMNHLNPSYIWYLHERKEIQYDLRTKHLCKSPITKTIKFGMESLSFRGSLLWNNLNDEMKELPTVASLETKIKTWMGEKCNARFVNSLFITLCSMYIIFLDIIVDYIANSCYQLVFFFKLCNTNLKHDYEMK